MEKLTLEEIHLYELDILREFDRICRENNLKYSLAGGTMLGAIRHKGFIPWDDDIDVCMPRPDYEKFRNIFEEVADNEKFYLTCDRGEKAIYPFTKMLYRRVEVRDDGFNEVKNLWIDILPVDGLPADNKKLKKIYTKAKWYRGIIYFAKLHDFAEYHGKHNIFAAKCFSVFAKMYGYKRALKKLDAHARKIDYNSSDYVGIISWGLYGIGERVSKKEYEESTCVEFEGISVLAMSCWDSYLHGLYGDYMQLPPEEKRICHGFTAYLHEED